MAIPGKVCRGPCGQRKSLLEFYNDRSQVDGKTKRCIACVKGARQPKADDLGPKVTAEESQRRSEQALAQHASGQLGQAAKTNGSLIPPGKTIVRHVLDQLRSENGEDILAAIRKSLKSSQPNIRLRAFSEVARLEHQAFEEELKSKSGKAIGDMDREEMIETIVAGFAELVKRGDIDEKIVDVFSEEMAPADQLPA